MFIYKYDKHEALIPGVLVHIERPGISEHQHGRCRLGGLRICRRWAGQAIIIRIVNIFLQSADAHSCILRHFQLITFMGV